MQTQEYANIRTCEHTNMPTYERANVRTYSHMSMQTYEMFVCDLTRSTFRSSLYSFCARSICQFFICILSLNVHFFCANDESRHSLLRSVNKNEFFNVLYCLMIIVSYFWRIVFQFMYRHGCRFHRINGTYIAARCNSSVYI